MQSRPTDGKAHILLVDDRPENLLALEGTLGDLGYELTRATSGHEALKQLLERDFAAILLDVQMPEMDGYDTARLIRSRERTQHIPIVFITAINKSESNVRRGYELGAVDYILKPCSPEVLRAKVNRLVEMSQGRRRLLGELEQQREENQAALQLSAELEKRVLERTTDLEALNTELRVEIARRERVEEELRARHEQIALQAEELAVQAEELQAQNDELLEQNHEIQRQNELLAQADQDKDRFLAMLSHELRNPLAAISNATAALDAAGPRDDRTQKLHAIIRRQTRHLNRMVDDLLDVSRITRGKVALRMEEVDARTAIARAAEAAHAIAEQHGKQVLVETPDTPLAVDADPVRLEQMISNLLVNAAKYSGKGERIWASAQAADNRIEIRVRDEGPGISPELLPRVFELFVQEQRTADRAAGGLGIGLTLVRELAQMHGGTVEARNLVEGGAEFILRLPEASGVAFPKLPWAQPAAPPISREPASRRVLLIEDNRDAAESLQDLLEQWGHESCAACNGPQGLKKAAEFRPEVVLLDIGMPGMDGYEVARRMLDTPELRDVILIALTGYGQAEDRRLAEQAGFHHHLTKPVDPEALRRLIEAS